MRVSEMIVGERCVFPPALLKVLTLLADEKTRQPRRSKFVDFAYVFRDDVGSYFHLTYDQEVGEVSPTSEQYYVVSLSDWVDDEHVIIRAQTWRQALEKLDATIYGGRNLIEHPPKICTLVEFMHDDYLMNVTIKEMVR